MVLVTHFLAKIYTTTGLIFEIFKFSKPKLQCFKRHFWQYEHGDHDLLRAFISSTDRNRLNEDDIDLYAFNITDKILSLAKKCILNSFVMIQPSDPPCITSNHSNHPVITSTNKLTSSLD